MKVGVVLLAALILVGTVAAAAGQAEWTPKDARAAVRALAYPKQHPRTVGCRGLGPTVAGGVYGSFRCRTTYRHSRRRTFYLVDDKTGWVCAGAHISGCHILPRGFVSTAEVARLGGFAESATQTSGAYVLAHYNMEAVGDGCTQTGPRVWSCKFSSPAVTVTLTYKKVKDGWTVKAA